MENQVDETSLLRDPIEDDELTRDVFARAKAEAVDELREYSRRLGSCHRLWTTRQRILKEKYGLDWFTPAQMNPGVVFD